MITQTSSNTHIIGKAYIGDVFVQQHGGWLCKEMAKSYSKGVWVVCGKPLLLNMLDRIHTKPVF